MDEETERFSNLTNVTQPMSLNSNTNETNSETGLFPTTPDCDNSLPKQQVSQCIYFLKWLIKHFLKD